MYPKNAASPPEVDLGQILQLSDGAIQTSGASVRVKIGTGAWGAGAGTLSCDATSGIWTYLPTQAETNADYFIVGVYKASCSALSKTVITSASATAGYAGLDWSKITANTTTVNLSGTTVKTATDVETDTQDIQSRLPAALVSGRMDSSVGNMESNVITSSVIATGAITGSAIQTNAITDDKLAASAITEIQSGLATSTQLTTVENKVDAIDDFVDTEVAAIKATTDKLDTTVELDGAVYRFTTNALEQAPSGGGGSTVIVSPLSALAPERVNGTTISVAVGDLTPVTIDVYDANDAAVNLSTQGNLEVCIESRDNVDLQVVAHANITISGTDSNKATWTPNAAAVGTVDKHRWSLRTAAAKKVLAYGPWVVERVALSDV